jgi:hypothetical protein
MTRRERLQLVRIWFFLGVLPLFLRPLREPDEARYAALVELANPGHARFSSIHGHFSRCLGSRLPW